MNQEDRDRVLNLERKIGQMKCPCDDGNAIFKTCTSRDYTIVAIAAAVAAVLLWIYMNYDKIVKVDKMDNRPRWPLGGLRDDTGATNNSTIFASGYGLDMTTRGAKTIQPGFDVKLGRSTYTDSKGHVQSEYSNWGTMEQNKGLADPKAKENFRLRKASSFKQRGPEKFAVDPKNTESTEGKLRGLLGH